jgi:hypothetical protein
MEVIRVGAIKECETVSFGEGMILLELKGRVVPNTRSVTEDDNSIVFCTKSRCIAML